MKVGTFVAKEKLPITEKETNDFQNIIVALIKKHFPSYSFRDNVEVEHKGGYTYIRYKNLFTKNITYRVTGTGDNWFVKNGDLVMPCSGLVFMLTKSKGYDEAKVGKFYEWKEGFTPEYDCEGYSAYLIWSGLHKSKGHRYADGLSVNEHYQYGTEISDLDFTNAMASIANIWYNSKVEKRIDLIKAR